MKKIRGLFAITVILVACQQNQENAASTTNALPIQGTWQLITGTLVEKGVTTVTDYTKGKSFIKIINGDHFSFLLHDLNKGKDSATNVFSAGGGKYTLKDSTYTEHLEYCNDRQWEGNDFSFNISIKNDTLTQHGIEKVDTINRVNTEVYVRVKN